MDEQKLLEICLFFKFRKGNFGKENENFEKTNNFFSSIFFIKLNKT